MAASEIKPKFNFSSTIPDNWSQHGLYRKNERGQASALITKQQHPEQQNELSSYLKSQH